MFRPFSLLPRGLVTRQFQRFVSAEYQSKTNEVKIDILTGSDTGILTLGLNKPKGKNSLSTTVVQSIESIIETINFDKSIKVMVLKSLVPGVFCSGADLKERLGMTQTEVYLFVSRLRKLMVSIENLRVPVIAAIDGAALGGGLELALACDIRIASPKTKLGLVETKLAIIPGAGGTQRLSRTIGPSLAKELIFTGRILSGEEAKEYCIVNHCVSGGDEPAYDKALSIAREIIPNGPVSVEMAKKAINKGIEVDITTGFTIEELCYAQTIPTKDRIEGLKAFQEKRKPVYCGC